MNNIRNNPKIIAEKINFQHSFNEPPIEIFPGDQKSHLTRTSQATIIIYTS